MYKMFSVLFFILTSVIIILIGLVVYESFRLNDCINKEHPSCPVYTCPDKDPDCDFGARRVENGKKFCSGRSQY
jgi:hypothetical protein